MLNQSKLPAMTLIATPVLQLEQLSQMNKAAGDSLRLGILQLLGQGAFGVLELSQIFEVKQSGMSHHLKVLAQAGLVSTQREGNSIFYRRPLLAATDELSSWLKALFQTIDEAEIGYNQEAVEQVMQERAQACADFFARHAHEFKEQQDLIASYEQYGTALTKLLQPLKDANQISGNGKALEIGPGEGAFLPELAKVFAEVQAIDISPDMLAKSQTLIKEEGLTNVCCSLGDTSALLNQQAQQYEFVVANMVLHHVPSPRNIFIDVGQLLQANGTFLVTDLVRHEQSWAKDNCGDLWLGFEPEDLTNWAKDAGLTEGQSQFLGLRNGFQIQFRIFNKARR